MTTRVIETISLGDNIVGGITLDNKLILTIDLNVIGELSASGKSNVLASTRGNKSIGDVNVGLNVYRYVSRRGRVA